MQHILLDLNEIAKENKTGPIACHWCIKPGAHVFNEFVIIGEIKRTAQSGRCHSAVFWLFHYVSSDEICNAYRTHLI